MTRHKDRRAYRLAIVLALCTLFLALLTGFARGSLAAPDGSGVVEVLPGNPIEIAVANSLIIAEAADIPLAVQMAIADYGAISGFSVQVNDFDTGCSTPTGASVAATIIANTQHVGVIGPLCTSSAQGALPVFQGADLVMISATSTGLGLYSFGPNVFNRVIPADPDFEPWNNKVSGLGTVQSWEADFETAQSHAPWEFARYAYDATTLLLTRIDEVSTVDGGGKLLIDRQALATAVRNTVDLVGITGNIALDLTGTRINQFVQAVLADGFEPATLGPAWSWIDEDPATWSLTARPGYLRIQTQFPTQNRLIRGAPEGDFEIRTSLTFTPTENFQFAGLSVFTDGDNFMNFGRAYCDISPPTCYPDAIYFDKVEGGVTDPTNHAVTIVPTAETHLRLVREGDTYRGYVSTNGTAWIDVGAHTVGFAPVYVGLYVSGQGSTSQIPADFDFFILVREADQLFLPMLSR